MNIETIQRMSYIAPFTGYGSDDLNKSLESGKESPESKNARFENMIEEERKRVAPVYDSKGKVIEYYENGKYLDIRG